MMSWGFLFRIRQHLKGSLWFLPLIGAISGPLLGELTLWLDRTVTVPAAWQYSASTASSVLTVLVGAMVGLLGFVVTISVLVVQQATGTLSPRFMRLWVRDPLQQVVLATFMATLTLSYSLPRPDSSHRGDAVAQVARLHWRHRDRQFERRRHAWRI